MIDSIFQDMQYYQEEIKKQLNSYNFNDLEIENYLKVMKFYFQKRLARLNFLDKNIYRNKSDGIITQEINYRLKDEENGYDYIAKCINEFSVRSVTVFLDTLTFPYCVTSKDNVMFFEASRSGIYYLEINDGVLFCEKINFQGEIISEFYDKKLTEKIFPIIKFPIFSDSSYDNFKNSLKLFEIEPTITVTTKDSQHDNSHAFEHILEIPSKNIHTHFEVFSKSNSFIAHHIEAINQIPEIKEIKNGKKKQLARKNK